jgi:hypothetical protein
MANEDIIGAVLRRTAIGINEPVDARIPLARFNKELDPLRPVAEVKSDDRKRR